MDDQSDPLLKSPAGVAASPVNGVDVPADTSGGSVAATTISTIAVQSGGTRMVIALLKVCDQLQLRVLECSPPLTRLGATLEEAEEMRSAHLEVIRQLQNKRSPVEELLRQADELIADQKTRPEVYTAMAECLSLAWKDINNRLEQRKIVLDLNVAFQRRTEECQGILLTLQMACTTANSSLARNLETMAECGEEVDALRAQISNLHDLRRASLEALMPALSQGKALLENLRTMAAAGSLDSRPDTGDDDVNYAISQVELWLEALHDRRRVLELTFSSCRTRLEQRLALAMVESECSRLEKESAAWKEQLTRTMDDLGDSYGATVRLLDEHADYQQRLKELQDHSLKMTKAAEQLVSSGAPGGNHTVARTFGLLNAVNECIQLYGDREALLQRTSKFFAEATDVISKLSQLWSQLTTAQMPLEAPQTASLHARAALVVDEVSTRLLDDGRAILQAVGVGAGEHKPGAEGVKRVVEELEDWRRRIDEECAAHKQQNEIVTENLNHFLEKQTYLFNWLVKHAEWFLQSHRDMDTALAPARDFQDQHLLLAADLQAKGSEINALLLTLPPIIDHLSDGDRREVNDKVNALHSRWLNLKALVEGRLLLVAPYVKFHTMAAQLANEMDAFEESMMLRVGRPDREKDLDSAWTAIRQNYVQLKHVGENFCADAAKVDDPHLDIEKAVNCVRTLLEHLSKRQFNVSESWQEWQHSVLIEREVHLKWERNIMESSRTVDWVSKLDSQLYPVLPDECGSASSVRSHIEEKLKAVLPEVKRAQDEVEEHLRTADALLAKGEGGEQGPAISEKLRELQHQLQELGSDYQVLLHLLVSHFTIIAELEKTISELKTSQESLDGSSEARLKVLEASYQAIAELVKVARTETEQIITKIQQQEPEAAAKHDTDRLRKLLDEKQAAFDSFYAAKSAELKQNQQRNAFDRDLAQINYAIADLGRQLEAIRGQYGEDVSSAKATSAAFDYFEKTIQLLEQRIENFITTTRQVEPSEKQEEEEAKKAKDIEDLQKSWKEFRGKVAENRRLIELSIQYFQLVEEASEWFKEGSRLLVSITRRSSAVRFPESANMLLTEIDTFLKPGEAEQDERIQKISELAKAIYGASPSQEKNTVAKENSEMINSFNLIREELVVLAKALSNAESAEESDKSTKPDDKVKIKSTETSDVELSETTTTTTTTTTFKVDSDGKRTVEKVETTTTSREGEPTVTMSETSHSEAETASVRGVTSPFITEITSESEEEVGAPPEFIQKLKDATIEEGGKFKFECRVTGIPAPKVVWEKDNMSIENNPDYLTSQENGVCTLTIEETFTADSARFTCRATNPSGAAETSATLSVKESEPELELSAPAFIVNLSNGSASEGAAHTLECLVKGEPLPTVQWFKEGTAIEDSSDRSISFNNGTARLRIEQVTLDDQGEYTCRAANSEGTASTTARLGVEPLKPVEAPTFPIPLSNVMARAGQKIKLECTVKGIPSPTVAWTQDGKPIKETRELKTHLDDGKATLVISEAFPKDAGTYVLTARNSAGEAFTSCSVTVKGRLPTETSDSELASDMEPTKPSIQLPLKNATAKEGDRVRLDCIIVGHPEPEVIWYHEGRPVKESADFQLLFQGDRCSLVLREIYLEDAGRYKVVAINSAGEASSECHLSVEGAVESEPPSRPSTAAVSAEATEKSETERSEVEKSEIEVSATEKSDAEAEKTDTEKAKEEKAESQVPKEETVEQSPKPVEELVEKKTVPPEAQPQEPVPPRFTKLLSDVLVDEGDSILLECTVEGRPKPSVRWTLNNKEVYPSDHVKLEEEDGGVIRLRITSAAPDDRGVYTARATNSLGEAKCFSNLIVKSALAESRTIELADRQQAPDFKERFVSRSVPLGTSTKFECIATGRPVPKVRWFFNDEAVSGKNFLVSKSGERDVLSIPQVSLENIGRVSCVAENDVGKASCSATLSVADWEIMAQPGGGDSIATVDDQSSGTFSMKRAVFMQSSSSTSTTTTSTGFGPPKTESHSVSSMMEQELKKEGSRPPQQVLVERKEEVHRVGEQPAQVHKEGTLVMSVDGDKRKETFSSSTNLPTTPKVSTRKSTAPRFVTPLNGKIVDQGTDILLEGIIDGYPTPTIEWTKNGRDISTLPEAARISTSWELNRVRLEMTNVTVKDAGRYSCKASNPVGTATSTADIVVKKTIFPPVFGRRLLVSQCRQGERVTLEVEVTGLPEPTVTWSKDGLPLSAFPHLEIRQRAQGNSYAIIIEKATTAHTGRYMVRATNAGGETQCTQDLAVMDPLPEELKDKASQDRIFQELMDFPSLQKHESRMSSSIKMSKDISSGLPPPTLSSLITPASATGESLHVTETSKTEKHFSIKVDGAKSPLYRPTGETQSKITTSKFSLGPEPKETTIPIQRESTFSSSATEKGKSPLDSFSILPKVSDLNYETVSKQVTKEETASSKAIHTKIEEQKHFSSSGSTKTTEIITERGAEESQNEAIDSSSIPTQTALQFFMSKIQEQKEPAPPKAAEPREQIPVQQKVTEKISKFEHYESKAESSDEAPQPKPEKEEVPDHPKVTEKISIFENYESKPEQRESSSKVEETSWRSTKEGVSFPSLITSTPLSTRDERVSSEIKSQVQHTRTVRQETRNWSGTYSVPTKPLSPPPTAPSWSPASKPLVFSEESTSSVYEKHFTPSETALSLQREFGLQPEPPPEMCYTPKAERSGKREDLADRMRRLEDSQKSVDPLHIPKGAVRIFPTVSSTTPGSPKPQTPKAAERKETQPSFLYPAHKEVKEETIKKEVRQEVKPAPSVTPASAPAPAPVEEIKTKKNAETVGSGVWTTRAAAAAEGPLLPVPSTSTHSSSFEESRWSQKSSESLFQSSSSASHSGPILRPAAADVPLRPTSPRPSAEAVSMEKLWTHQRTPESAPFPFPHQAPLESSFESKSSSFSKYERTSKGPASPSPSFGGLAADRTWAPSRLTAPQNAERPVSPRPSSEGLAMDKMWAHKKSSVKKIWPPPPPAEEKILAPWATQYSSSSTEKVTTEDVATAETVHVQKREYEKVVQEKETAKCFSPVEPPKPQGFRPVIPPARKPAYSFQPETPPPLHNQYHSTSDVSHKSSMEQISSQFSKTYEISKVEQSESSWNGTPIPRDPSPPIVEERHIRPSEAKRLWPPNKSEYELQAPKMVRKVQRPERHFKPLVSQLPCSEPVPQLEPGPPPEMGYAAPPSQPRRRSYVELIEEDLEKNLEKGPSRVVPGGVRIIPPAKRETPKPVISPAPREEPLSWRPSRGHPIPAQPLEPFPFQAEPGRPKQKVFVPPPPTPSKFVKGEFVSSDYESDLETTRISAKWRPSRSSYSDTETCSYRRVRPPSAPATPAQWPPASYPEPLPPSRLEQPAPLSTLPKHGMKHETRISSSVAAAQALFNARSAAPAPLVPPLNLKPGSPPVYCQKKTPDSPRAKKCQRLPAMPAESGYMADTDEPRTWKPTTPKTKSPSSPWGQSNSYESTSTMRVEQRSTFSQESSFQSMQKITSTEQVAPPPIQTVSSFKSSRHHAESRLDKRANDLSSVSSGSVAMRTDQRFLTRDRKEHPVQRPASAEHHRLQRSASAEPPLEPFPFKPEPPRAKRAAGPPPPSPSKFVKGEFRESDYESDYDGRIPIMWRPYESDTDERSYRRVRPALTPSLPTRRHTRTPTPPTEFDNPPHFGGPPRPKFEPIEKPLAAVKLDEILQPAMKVTQVVRPKPIQAKPIQTKPAIETFLVKSLPKEPLPARFDIQPGSPPELGFAPPSKGNQYPAVHETSKSMSFAEATETSRRVVSMQKTTRVYQFGEKESEKTQKDIILEPFPFVPEPPRSKKRAIGPPPARPTKFVPGEFRESDYESEMESTRIRARWAPTDSDTDEPHYRKVRPPSVKRCSSVPLQSPVDTPDVASLTYMPPTPPPENTAYSLYELQEQKRLQRVEEMRRRFEEKTESKLTEKQINRQIQPVRRVSESSAPDFTLKPGSPPEFAFSGKSLPTQATSVASHHMNEMTQSFKSKTQRFMEDIVSDSKTTTISKKPERPILKKQLSVPTTQSESDQQAFREETRLSEYGTKHIDPDTGLIYFKYDFGYEFGLILPGEGKRVNGKASVQKSLLEKSNAKEEDSIDFPVIHERTGRSTKGFSKTTDDIKTQTRSKKTLHNKSVKWEATSESEVSELEVESRSHRYSLPQPLPSYQTEPRITIPPVSSPSTLSPSLPSLSPFNTSLRADTADAPAPGTGQAWTQSAGKSAWSVPTAQAQPVNANLEDHPPRPPSFITPLRDIAVVNGQTARFECIVQAEPAPNILWAKDGRILEHCQNICIQYRNGVCRLTISGANSRNAGSYTCTATNRLGTSSCTATLLVPGERRASLGAFRS